MDGWMDGWIDEWIGHKTSLTIGQHSQFLIRDFPDYVLVNDRGLSINVSFHHRKCQDKKW
jgi:hypothetical protein